PVALANAAEERSLLVAANSGGRDPSVQILLETGMAGPLVALATFFMQSEPPAFAMLEVVAHLHGDSGADPGKAVDHCPDEGRSCSPIKVLPSIESSSLRASSDEST